MWPNRVSNPESLALESDALPTTLLGPVPGHVAHLVARLTEEAQVLGSTYLLVEIDDFFLRSFPIFHFYGHFPHLRKIV